MTECHCCGWPLRGMFAPALSQVAQLYLPSLHSPSSCSNDRCQYSLGGAPNFSVGWGPYCALHTGALFLVEGRRKAWPADPVLQPLVLHYPGNPAPHSPVFTEHCPHHATLAHFTDGNTNALTATCPSLTSCLERTTVKTQTLGSLQRALTVEPSCLMLGC